MQSNLLNEAGHPSTTVLPLTTQLIEESAPLRYRLAARNKQPDPVLNIIMDSDDRGNPAYYRSQMLTILAEKEINEVEAYWRIVLGLD